MALYHRLSMLLHACNVKIVKSEYSCTKVQNKYNIKKNIII